ncbi:hypothetical protein [Rheinheimera sp.]|uniref:hypothetical protein n=1 Tax=Rheinheimera sp. TaxID=1869214 RepID=UPI00307D2A70
MLKRKSEPLENFQTLYRDAFGMDGQKHDRASKFFGVTPQTCRRWYEQNAPHPTAHRYLHVHCAGYLPLMKGWSTMRIDQDGSLVTPWGNCSPGDVAMIWRYKWASANATRQLQAARQKIEDMQSDAKLKMIKHTTDYLNRLVHEFSGQ